MRDPRSARIFWILTAAFLASRLFILFNSERIYNVEELYIGTVAKELVSGPKWPLIDYQHDVYEGRTLVSGITAASFFLVFGESVRSLKLVGVFFAVIGFMLFYRLLEGYFPRKTGILAALMYIIPSAPVMVGDVLGALSGWFMFSPVMMLFLFTAYGRKNDSLTLSCGQAGGKAFVFFSWGLLSGFFAYLHPLFILAAAAYLAFIVLLDRRFAFRSAAFCFLTGALAGYLPAVYYNIARGFPLLWNIKGQPLANYLDIGNLFVNFKVSVLSLKLLFQFASGAANAFFYALSGSAYCWMFWKYRREISGLFSGKSAVSGNVLLVLYPLFYLFALSLVNTKRGPQTGDYILLYPFLLIITASFFSWLFERARIASTLIVLCSGVLLTVNLAGLVSSGNWREARSEIKPYAYESLAVCFFLKHYWRHRPVCEKYMDKIGLQHQPELRRGIQYFHRIIDPKTENDKWERLRQEFAYETETWGY